MKKLFLSLLACLFVTGAMAQSNIITWLKPGVNPQQLPFFYPINLVDFSVDGPFALYVTKPGFNVDAVQASMRQGGFVYLAEDDANVVTPENLGATKGGTIGAVFDPAALRIENTALMAQIKYTARPFAKTDRIVRVGILDTGMPQPTLMLRRKVIASAGFAPDRVDAFDLPTGADSNSNGKPDEAIGHGSMVMGLVDQIAPYSRYAIARVADADGNSTAWRIIKGLAFVCARGVEVVNISLGTSDDVIALGDIIEGWVDPQGIVVVAPAGNNGWKDANEPGKFSHVVCVTGVDPFDVKASFSNWDSHVDHSAPATGVKSAWWDGTLGIWSGTSFASPLVAGSVVDGLRSRPRITGALRLNAFRETIEDTGDDIDGKNPNYRGKIGLRLNHGLLVQRIIGF